MPKLSSPALMIGLATLLLAACGREQTAAVALRAPDLPFQVLAPTRLGTEQVLDGSLEAVNQATVSAQTSGRILALPVDVNQPVQAGAVVARLRDTEQRARLGQAEASLKAAQAMLAESDKTWQRIQDIYQKKLVAAAQLDHAAAEHDAARAQLAAALAARDQAAEQLDYTVVRAPYAGVVTSRAAQVGDAVLPGQPLLTLQGGGDIRAVLDVPQQTADRLRGPLAARVIFADDSSVLGGSVTVFPNADPVTHTFRVRVGLPASAAAGNHAGQLVRVAFSLGSETGLTLPAADIAWRGEVAGAYVLEGDRVEFRAIRPGRTLADGSVQVLAGLAAGEKLVTRPDLAVAWLAQGAAP